MSNPIPRVVADWIALQLPERRGSVSALEYGGISSLRVAELKIIGPLLYETQAVMEEFTISVRRISSSAKKRERIDFVRRALYKDDACTQLNIALLEELEREVPGYVSSAAAPVRMATPSSTSSGKKRQRDTSSHNGESHTATVSLGTPASKSSSAAPKSACPAAAVSHSHSSNKPKLSLSKKKSPSSKQKTSHSVASRKPTSVAVAAVRNGHHHESVGRASAGPTVSAPSARLGAPPLDFSALLMGSENHAELFRSMSQNPHRFLNNSAAPLTTGAPSAAPSSPSMTNAAQQQQRHLPSHFATARGYHSHLSSQYPNNFASLASMAAAAAPGNTTATESALPTVPNFSTTYSSDPNQPRNATEFQLMAQLAQMGFTDRQEMINGIRQSKRTTADEVMLFIITQREEAEESRKEDEVRLLSEDQQREQKQLQKAQRAKQLASAKTANDLMAIFGKSWILKGLLSNDNSKGCRDIIDSTIMTQRRREFLELLDLEEKSAKWYVGLPSHYFQGICGRLKTESGGTIPWLPVECEKLQRGLTLLSEQVGGRPKLFVEAMNEATGITDEEVIVIE